MRFKVFRASGLPLNLSKEEYELLSSNRTIDGMLYAVNYSDRLKNSNRIFTDYLITDTDDETISLMKMELMQKYEGITKVYVNMDKLHIILEDDIVL